MAWRKSPPELIAFFDALVAGRPGLEPRQMFGYPAAFMNGKLAAGLHQESMILRLSADDADAFAKLGAKPFEPMPGRRMGGFMTVPPALLADGRALTPWLERAIANSARLAATAPTKKKPAKRAQA